MKAQNKVSSATQATPKKSKGTDIKKDISKKGDPKKDNPKKDDPKIKLVGITDLANVVGVEIRMIRHLQQQGIIEPESISKSEGNKYNFVVCVHKLFKYYREKADSRRSGDSEEMAEEKLRQITARRELEEMKVKRTRGELHHTEDIKRIFGTMLSRLRTGLESFPLGIAPKLTEKTDLMEIAGIIKNQLDKIMYEVTEYDIDKIKTDVGAEYIAGLEAENKTESHESDQGV